MTAFVIRWLVTTVAVLVAAHVIPGVTTRAGARCWERRSCSESSTHLFGPILLLLSLPFIIVTMGLFIFVINALLLMLVSKIMPAFQVSGF